MAVKTDLQLAFEALSAKAKPYTDLWDYYDGRHPLVYSATRLRQIFSSLDARFSENWCAVVIDAAVDRMVLQRFEAGDDQAGSERINALMTASGVLADAHDVHLAAQVCGEAFVVVWDDGDGVEAYYNDPRMVHVFYDVARPRVKRLAAKWWVDDDERRRLTLYYPDRLEYYSSKGKAANVQSWRDFRADEAAATAPNRFGEVPVFHFRRERRAIKSDLANAIEPQNAVNKLLADMMVAAEFGAFRQRYVISNAETISKLKNAPNEIWDVPGGDGDSQPTQVGEFSQTDLKNYLDAIRELVSAIAIITRTPKHFLFQQGGDPSGEALIAMEAPLNKKVRRLLGEYGRTWEAVAAFVGKVAGSAELSRATAVYDEPETIQPLTQAQIRQATVAAGVPLRTALRREGWSDAALADLEADKAEGQKAEQATLSAAMLAAQKNLDASV